LFVAWYLLDGWAIALSNVAWEEEPTLSHRRWISFAPSAQNNYRLQCTSSWSKEHKHPLLRRFRRRWLKSHGGGGKICVPL
jgi:hypothetical protein